MASMVVLVTVAYTTAPYLLPQYLSSYLKTQGVELSEFNMNRPSLRRLEIDRLALMVDGMEVVANGISIRYHFSGLLERRIDEVKIQRLSIALPPPISGSNREITLSPWALIPVDALTVSDFELTTAAPAANFVGRISLSPSSAKASLRISSERLPQDLVTRLHLQPSGHFVMQIAPPDSQPVLSLEGQHDSAGQIKFDGDLKLDGAAFEFALRLAGIDQPSGRIIGTFAGTGALKPQGAVAMTGTGDFELEFRGNVAGATGLTYMGHVELFLGPEQLRAESKGSTIGVQTIETPDGQYLFDNTFIKLDYRAQIPINGGLPNVSLIAGEADLNLSINLPGATRASETLVLHDLSLTGVATARLNDDLHGLSGKLIVNARQFDYENILFEPNGEGLALNFDLNRDPKIGPNVDPKIGLKRPPDSSADPFARISGQLGAEIVTLITSRTANAPIQSLGLDAGVRVSIENGRYSASIVPNSLVNIITEALDLGFESLDTFIVEVSPDGTISNNGGILSTRFVLTTDDQQQLRYTNARLNIDSLVVGANNIAAMGSFRSDRSSKALPLNFVVNGKRDSATGTFEVSANHLIDRPVLKKELPGWVADYDLLGGQLNFSLKGTFDVSDEPRFDAAGEVSLKEVVARYDDISMTGVNADFPLRVQTDNLHLGPGPMFITSIDIGFPASEIAFQLETDTSVAKVDDFSANLLAADISIGQLVYNIDDASSQFTVQVQGLPVANVLALEGEDINGDGIIDGNLPVELTNAGVTVAGGSFTSRPPGGYLRYLGDLPATSMGLDLAIRALRNFEYTEMKVGVDYAPDGALAALVRLRGKSQDVENGRPIHFNVNVTENIPALLESIRASEATERRVQQRLSR